MDIKYEFKPAYTLLTVNLEPGESIKVEPGAMVAQSADISVSTGELINSHKSPILKLILSEHDMDFLFLYDSIISELFTRIAFILS